MRKTIQVLTELQQCAEGWNKSACLVGNVRAGDIATACRNAVRRLKTLSAINTAQHRKAVKYRHAAQQATNSANPPCGECIHNNRGDGLCTDWPLCTVVYDRFARRV